MAERWLEPDVLGGPVMRLVVAGRPAMRRITPNVPYVVVSISDPGAPEAVLAESPLRLGVLRLSFFDATADDARFRGATPEDAVRIVEFVARYREAADLIVCQCEAGLSRSPAVAAALSRWLNGHDEEFHRRYQLNLTVYRLVRRAAEEYEVQAAEGGAAEAG